MHTGAWLVWDKRLTESADKMFGSCFELIWSKRKHKREILRYKWASVFSSEPAESRRRLHPTQKPSGLLRNLLQRYSQDGVVVGDWFLGSGTTMVAAEQTGRICYGMEIEPKYVSVSLERMEGMGLEPRLIENGK